ncbi:MAG TPA: carboxypeptidase-like regulatory domain-containing protein [Vicinamibacterales bacterium]|jgi:hypothetical protein
MKVAMWRSLALLTSVLCFGSTAAFTDTPDRPDAKKTAVAHAPGAPRPVGSPTGSVAAIGGRAAVVVGNAWTADNAPIKQASLRLRDVVSGKVEAVTIANDDGRFVFEDVPGGSYAVELLNATGRIEVVGNVFTIAPGETVATFVRTGTKVPWVQGFFNSTMSVVTATAASAGVAALAPVARPASAKQ